MDRRHLLLGGLGLAAAQVVAPQPPFRVPQVRQLSAQRDDIRPREAWAAGLAPTGPLQREDEVAFLLVHHTAGTNDYRSDDVPALIQEIFRLHTKSRHWPDVAYNFFVDRYGGMWEGRAGSLVGPVQADATGGNQGFAQLCCLLGNHQEAPPTQEALDGLVTVLAFLAQKYAIATEPEATANFSSRGSNRWPAGQTVTTRTISGHRDMSQTLCPGDYLYAELASAIPTRVHAAVTAAQGLSEVPATTSVPAATTTEPAPPPPTSVGPPPAGPPAAVGQGEPSSDGTARADSRLLVGGGAAAAAGAGLLGWSMVRNRAQRRATSPTSEADAQIERRPAD